MDKIGGNINICYEEGMLTKEEESIIFETLVTCIKEENLRSDILINVTIVGDTEIQKINKEERNIDKTTDVLSFPMYEKEEIEEKIEDIYKKSDILACLGDIVVNIEKVKRQAIEYETGEKRELSYMVVHSFYHLMGYDHIEKEDKEKMREKEENILRGLNLCK